MLTSDNAGAIAAICTRVDGLPLAIELVAARLRTLAPELLLAPLTDWLTSPHDSADALPERHRTLRNAIAFQAGLRGEWDAMICQLTGAADRGAPYALTTQHLAQEWRDEPSEYEALSTLGLLAYAAGNYAHALPLMEGCLVMAARLPNGSRYAVPRAEAWTLWNLAHTAAAGNGEGTACCVAALRGEWGAGAPADSSVENPLRT